MMCVEEPEMMLVFDFARINALRAPKGFFLRGALCATATSTSDYLMISPGHLR